LDATGSYIYCIINNEVEDDELRIRGAVVSRLLVFQGKYLCICVIAIVFFYVFQKSMCALYYSKRFKNYINNIIFLRI